MVEEEDNDKKRWGTWEELILGGAVMRHGSQDWNAVASELQTRTLYPFLFTPQICKAKYEDLQKRYSGSSAWFEELRKRRVEELRKALEESKDSIGSLQSKLETLKAEKRVIKNTGYNTSRAEFPELLFLKSEGNESSGKEASKDGLSVGSFTQETQTNRSSQGQVAREVSVERKPIIVAWEPSRLEKFPSIDKLEETIRSEGGVSIRRRRGKRRRKDLSKDVKEGSVGESNLLGSADCGKERSADERDRNPCTSGRLRVDDFAKILGFMMENEHASVFRRRLDSQKRARYKKIIRRHMDLDTILSKITDGSIKSPAELFRDLLLISNNALVFYSKSTREFKSASILRDLVIRRLRQAYGDAVDHQKPVVRRPPAKPRSARPFIRRPAANGESGCGVKQPAGKVDSPSSAGSSVVTKRSPGNRGKLGRVRRGNGGGGETPMKVRKKPKVK